MTRRSTCSWQWIRECWIPDHKAPSDLIFQALEGEAVLHVGGKDLNVKKGDFLYLKEGTLHHLQAVTKFKFSMVRIYK